MTTTSDIRVSVDVGCHRHSVAIGLPSGQVLDEFDVEHRPEGFNLFFDRIDHLQQQYGGAVSVAMEGYNGWARPLDTLVRSHGYRLFNINNLKLARFKEIFPAAAKSDRIDARKNEKGSVTTTDDNDSRFVTDPFLIFPTAARC